MNPECRLPSDFPTFNSGSVKQTWRDLLRLPARSTSKTVLAFAVSAIATSVVTDSLLAHETSENRTGIVVNGATLAPVAAGQTATVQMNITNLRTRPLYLTGIEADFAGPAVITMGLSPETMSRADLLPILHDETLELDTSHIKATFPHIDRPLKDGDEVVLFLDFNGLVVEAVADVH